MSDSINELSPALVQPSRGRRLLRIIGDRTGPPIRSEWQELGLVIEALPVARSTRVVQFVGPMRSVGTTVVATGFAQAAALKDANPRSKDMPETPTPVLLLDCGPDSEGIRRVFRSPRRAETVFEAYQRDPKLESFLGVASVSGVVRAYLGLVDRDGAVRHSSESLAELISVLRSRYSAIVLDCPAISQSIAGLLLAPHSDSTIIVVKAGSTRSADLTSARARLEQVGGVLAGVVFNRMRVKS